MAKGAPTTLRRASMDVYTRAMRLSQLPSRPALSRFMERRRALRLAATLPLAMLVTGCGQKGPLYHPPEPAPPEPGAEDEDDQTSAAPPAPGSRLA